MTGDVILENESLRVTVSPRVGGTIRAIVHKSTGLSVLGTVPWPIIDEPMDPPAAPDEPAWLTRYTGGWPLLFPNGGDACIVDGVFHGFHGEGSVAPWVARSSPASMHLTRDFVTVPVRMDRDIALEDEVVVVRERAILRAAMPVSVMWGHHPTFGSDLLARDFELQTGARTVRIDSVYDAPVNPFVPGAVGSWPMIAGKSGALDLRLTPRGDFSGQAYLLDFDSPWISIRRIDDAIAIALSWDPSTFPCAWLWYEFCGLQHPPWSGKTRLIGLEPITTCLGYGLAKARAAGESLLAMQPGVPVGATVRLNVFKPAGPVTGVARDGRALIAQGIAQPAILGNASPFALNR